MTDRRWRRPNTNVLRRYQSFKYRENGIDGVSKNLIERENHFVISVITKYLFCEHQRITANSSKPAIVLHSLQINDYAHLPAPLRTGPTLSRSCVSQFILIVAVVDERKMQVLRQKVDIPSCPDALGHNSPAHMELENSRLGRRIKGMTA